MKRVLFYIFGIAGITLITIGTAKDSAESLWGSVVSPQMQMPMTIAGIVLILVGVFCLRRNR